MTRRAGSVDVILSNMSSFPVTIFYNLLDPPINIVRPLQPEDYTLTPGSPLTIPAGSSQVSLQFAAIADGIYDGDPSQGEGFTLQLTSADGAMIGLPNEMWFGIFDVC